VTPVADVTITVRQIPRPALAGVPQLGVAGRSGRSFKVVAGALRAIAPPESGEVRAASSPAELKRCNVTCAAVPASRDPGTAQGIAQIGVECRRAKRALVSVAAAIGFPFQLAFTWFFRVRRKGSARDRGQPPESIAYSRTFDLRSSVFRDRRRHK
jgi:hypothetical protein